MKPPNRGSRGKLVLRFGHAGCAIVIGSAIAIACSSDGGDPTAPSEHFVGGPSLQSVWNGTRPTCGALQFAVVVSPPILAVGGNGAASFAPGDATGGVSWTSTDNAVATVLRAEPATENWHAQTTAVGAGYACIHANVTNGSGERNGQAQIAVPGLRVVPGAVTANARESQQLTVAAAVAADGSSFPSAPVAWSSADTGIAAVDAGGFVHTVNAGTTNVTAILNGVSTTIPISVAPVSTITGPNEAVVERTTTTYGLWTLGCNSSCTYQWSMRWIDATTLEVHFRTLGTGTTQSVTAPINTHSYELNLRTTSNGVSGDANFSMSVIASSGCTKRSGC